MAVRNIVKIDRDKCNGCGDCVSACVEGAIEIVDGKAELVSETYCDGLGACLGHCPQDAITIETRQADEFDEKATEAYLAAKGKQAPQPSCPTSQSAGQKDEGFQCPGLASQMFNTDKSKPVAARADDKTPSALSHWPVQLKLVSPGAPYFKNADLLLVADCVPFAMADFHRRLLSGKSVAIGCPKLDDAGFYVEKLAEIIDVAAPASLTVVHMEVPCCFGLTRIAKQAIARAGASLTFDDITVGVQGDVIKTDTISL